MKMIKDVVPDKRPLNGCVCVCVAVQITYHDLSDKLFSCLQSNCDNYQQSQVGPLSARHCVTCSMLYTELDTECDKLAINRCKYCQLSSLTTVQFITPSTHVCQLNLQLQHVKIDRPWVPEFGIKFDRKILLFWRHPNFPVTQCRRDLSRTKPPCQKPALWRLRPVVSVWCWLAIDIRLTYKKICGQTPCQNIVVRVSVTQQRVESTNQQ